MKNEYQPKGFTPSPQQGNLTIQNFNWPNNSATQTVESYKTPLRIPELKQLHPESQPYNAQLESLFGLPPTTPRQGVQTNRHNITLQKTFNISIKRPSSSYCISQVNMHDPPVRKTVKVPNPMLVTFGKKRINEQYVICACQPTCQWSVKWTGSYATGGGEVYQNLKSIPVKPQILLQIQKGVKQVSLLNRSFQAFKSRKLLQQVLQAYSKYDKQLQYAYGINIVASVLLYHLHRPETTFCVLLHMMEHKQLRSAYNNNHQLVSEHVSGIKSLFQEHLSSLYKHLVSYKITQTQLQVDIQQVLTGWTHTLMCTLVPYEFSHHITDGFLDEGWESFYGNVLLVLQYLEDRLLRIMDRVQVTDYLAQTNRDESIDWKAIFAHTRKTVIV